MKNLIIILSLILMATPVFAASTSDIIPSDEPVVVTRETQDEEVQKEDIKQSEETVKQEKTNSKKTTKPKSKNPKNSNQDKKPTCSEHCGGAGFVEIKRIK